MEVLETYNTFGNDATSTSTCEVEKAHFVEESSNSLNQSTQQSASIPTSNIDSILNDNSENTSLDSSPVKEPPLGSPTKVSEDEVRKNFSIVCNTQRLG